jgi:hypothetical protein
LNWRCNAIARPQFNDRRKRHFHGIAAFRAGFESGFWGHGVFPAEKILYNHVFEAATGQIQQS